MRKFIRSILKFSLGLIVLIAIPTFLYVKQDVYSDFGIKTNYSWKYRFQTLGDVSTKKLLIATRAHNSFIFGSSRSCGLYACYLQEKIPDSKFFHYANWAETIGGIYHKLKLIDSLGYKIDNAVFYFDTDNTFKDDGKPSKRDHYLISGQRKSTYLFKHYQNFFTHLSVEKLNLLFGKEIEGKNFPNWESDLNTNDSNHTCNDSIIETYGDSTKDEWFINKIDSLRHIGFLYKRPTSQVYKSKQISKKEDLILKEIKAILAKHHTNYYIIVTPLYDQLKFNIDDFRLLKSYFGNNLYDFSGRNAITNDFSNYPDEEHFLRHISKKMVDSIIK